MRRAAFSKLSSAVERQESGGRIGIEGSPTQWGRAAGLMQVLPETAREMAGKLGLPYRPELMTGKSAEAANYQRRIGEAYLQEGLAKTGNMRDALHYYHGGPDRSMWGPKTRSYATSVLSRMRNM